MTDNAARSGGRAAQAGQSITRTFCLQWTELWEGLVEAESEDEARQMWREGAIDNKDLHSEDLDDIREVEQ